jgi:1D-myo-inositol 3-kinase
MAQALGARVTLITSAHPGYDRSVFGDLDVREVPAASSPRYANTYDSDGNRTQLLLDTGASLDDFAWPTLPRCDVFLLAPAYHEFTRTPPVDAGIRAISLQGALRSRNGNRVVRSRSPFSAAETLVSEGSYAFLSDEDTRYPVALARRLALLGAKVLITRGHRGATLYDARTAEAFPALPAAELIDPTGAGDCFATSFAVRLAETADEREAMRFALAAGSLSVEAPGLDGIPTREAIERRLHKEAA